MAAISLILSRPRSFAAPWLPLSPSLGGYRNSEQLFTEVEVASGGYLPSREAAR